MLDHRYAVPEAIRLGSEHAPALLRARFRIARSALLGQGLAIGVVGGFALAWSMANLHFGLEGIPVLGLTVTPLHGGLLMVVGALSILACLGRWPTVVAAALATAGWGTLTVVCAVQAGRHAPGPLGFDPRDTMLYAALSVYNLAICVVLTPALRRMLTANSSLYQ